MTNTVDLVTLAQAGDNTACETLVIKHSALVWSIVRRFSGRSADADDLYQIGCMGLLKAVKGFDVSLGHKFSTYAVPKILGEIRRFLRDDGMVKVSRSLKEQSCYLSRLREALCQTLGREPVLSELATASGLTPEEIVEIDTSSLAPESLSRETTENGTTLEELLGDEGIEDRVVERISLSDAIKQLSRREQIVIYSRFYKGLTQAKTAKIVALSQVQVSRIERAAIQKLREIL